MKIILIRHGETEANKNGVMQGQIDFPLNTVGIKQARRIANKLKKEQLTVIYSSDLQRAYKTAEIIRSQAFPSTALISLPELRELSIGKLEGQKWEKISFHTKDDFRRLMEEYGGEDPTQFKNRVWSAFLRILDKHKNDDTLAIVTHGGCIRIIIQEILQAKKVFDTLKISNGSITIIHARKEKNNVNFEIERMNDISHLV